MDTVTHGLAGYIIAKTGLAGDTGAWGTATGVTAALAGKDVLFRNQNSVSGGLLPGPPM